MHVERINVSVTTIADGSATAFTDRPVTGTVLAVMYTKHGSNPYDDTVDITITGEGSGIAILTQANATASFTKAPRMPTHGSADGAAALYAAGGTAVNAPIPVANERIKIVLAQGGDSNNGDFTFYIG